MVKTKGDHYVMTVFCRIASSLSAGHGHNLYVGRLYPSLTGCGRGG